MDFGQTVAPTLSETMRDLLEVFEAAGSTLTFDAYMIDLWREALTEALDAAQTLEAAVIEAMGPAAPPPSIPKTSATILLFPRLA